MNRTTASAVAAHGSPQSPPLAQFDAVIFDLDGVVADTARLHAAAWKRTFDGFLRRRAERRGEPFEAFDIARDYRRLVDGKPRLEGIAAFLAARHIALPPGTPDDPPDADTVHGLGNAKNALFQELLRRGGADPVPETIAVIRELRRAGRKTAVVSASRNCRTILETTGLGDLFDTVVDGNDAARQGLPGKPKPDTFLEAARRLSVDPRRAVVVEDAGAGVRAAHDGGFGLVVGLARGNDPAILSEGGADIVVDDLRKLPIDGPESGGATLPSALAQRDAIVQRLGGRRLALFLDYDGTLTPIVERPELAILAEDMRQVLRALADKCTLAVISGRDLNDVEKLVAVDGIYYSGNHGFRVQGPGWRHASVHGAEFLPVLDRAERALRPQLAPIEGVLVERKFLSIAIHYRLTPEAEAPAVEAVVDAVAAANPELRKGLGKKVFELQPNIDWNKGKAVLSLLQTIPARDAFAMFIGDDVTDEDAFAALRGAGIGIVVMDPPRPSAAQYRLRDTDEVRQFLQGLLDALS